MKNSAKFLGITAACVKIVLVFVLNFASCATYVPMKGVRAATIGGMESVKKLGIKDFENKSGSSAGSQVAITLSDIAKQQIQSYGKFEVIGPADPNADGIFYGEVRSVISKDELKPGSYTDKEGNTKTWVDYYRTVEVEFVYGVINTRTGMPFGSVAKKDSTQDSARDNPSGLKDAATLAKQIAASKFNTLKSDILPTIVDAERVKIEKETLKDKTAKGRMKTAESMVKAKNYSEALRIYDEVAEQYGSDAAKINANTLRRAIAAEASANAQIAQLDSARVGGKEKAAKSAVDILSSKLPAGTIIMIVKSGSVERNLLNDVVDNMTTTIVQEGKLKVVDRSNHALINAEQSFQMSGNVDDNTAVSVGRQLGAKFAVVCEITGVSSSRRLNVKLLNIETSQIDNLTQFDI